jgi:hypothetical protein
LIIGNSHNLPKIIDAVGSRVESRRIIYRPKQALCIFETLSIAANESRADALTKIIDALKEAIVPRRIAYCSVRATAVDDSKVSLFAGELTIHVIANIMPA